MKELMLGNKAVARGLYEAGCGVISSYPGTPSTEITEEAAKYPEIYCEWAPNEKVALEVAHGAAVGGVWRGRGGNPRAHTGEKPGCRGRKRAVVPGNGAQPGAFRAASGSQHRAEAGKTGRRQGCAGGFWRGFQGAKRGQRGGKGGISGLKAAKRAGKALHTVGFGRKTGRSTTYFGRRVTGSRSLPTARALTRVQARFARI